MNNQILLNRLEQFLSKCGRYDIEYRSEGSDESEMKLHPTGDYILFDDVTKCIAALRSSQAGDAGEGEKA